METRPVGLWESYKALDPFQRLAVIFSFSSVGLVGSALLMDGEDIKDPLSSSSSSNGGLLGEYEKFMKWLWSEIEKDRMAAEALQRQRSQKGE